jgi:hypothetical protein
MYSKTRVIRAMSKAKHEAEFNDNYVTSNINAGAPGYSADILRKMYDELRELDQEEFKHYGYAVLVCCSKPYLHLYPDNWVSADSHSPIKF